MGISSRKRIANILSYRFLDVAKDLDRKVDRPPCAAPCEGGKARAVEAQLLSSYTPYSDLFMT